MNVHRTGPPLTRGSRRWISRPRAPAALVLIRTRRAGTLGARGRPVGEETVVRRFLTVCVEVLNATGPPTTSAPSDPLVAMDVIDAGRAAARQLRCRPGPQGSGGYDVRALSGRRSRRWSWPALPRTHRRRPGGGVGLPAGAVPVSGAVHLRLFSRLREPGCARRPRRDDQEVPRRSVTTLVLLPSRTGTARSGRADLTTCPGRTDAVRAAPDSVGRRHAARGRADVGRALTCASPQRALARRCDPAPAPPGPRRCRRRRR